MRSLSILMAASLAVATLPAATHAASVTEGRRAWLQYNCSGCHGDSATGGMGPNIRQTETQDVKSAITGDAVEGGMRSFVGNGNLIPSSQVTTVAANIAAYLAVAGTKAAPTWVDWWNAKP